MAEILIFDEGASNLIGSIRGKAAKIIEACAKTDEPIFVLRAQDIFSVMAIGSYVDLLAKFAPGDYDMEESLVELITEFKTWQRNHISEVRYPD